MTRMLRQISLIRPLRLLRPARPIGSMRPTRPMWTNANEANANKTDSSKANEANKANENLADAKEVDANKTIPDGCSLTCTPSQIFCNHPRNEGIFWNHDIQQSAWKIELVSLQNL